MKRFIVVAVVAIAAAGGLFIGNSLRQSNAVRVDAEAPPQLVTVPVPEYPVEARGAGLEDKVILEVTVGEDGHVSAVRVVESKGYTALDEAAIKAAKSAIFEPARRHGQPVAVVVRMPVNFTLSAS